MMSMYREELRVSLERMVKEAVYKRAVVLNMFEGIRFFCTFVTNWSFSEQPEKLMAGSLEMR